MSDAYKSRIRRAAFQANAADSKDLTWRAKCYLVLLTELPAESEEDGRRRYGSKPMNARGEFSLHRDYIARMLGTDEQAVRKAQRECVEKGYLSMVWSARHGLPNRLQALSHRGSVSDDLTGAKTDPLRRTANGSHRGSKTDPVCPKAPDHLGHEPTSRGLPLVVTTVTSSGEDEAEGSHVGGLVTGCPWHDETHPCPEDCANHPDTRRRTA